MPADVIAQKPYEGEIGWEEKKESRCFHNFTITLFSDSSETRMFDLIWQDLQMWGTTEESCFARDNFQIEDSWKEMT